MKTRWSLAIVSRGIWLYSQGLYLERDIALDAGYDYLDSCAPVTAFAVFELEIGPPVETPRFGQVAWSAGYPAGEPCAVSGCGRDRHSGDLYCLPCRMRHVEASLALAPAPRPPSRAESAERARRERESSREIAARVAAFRGRAA